MNILEQIVVQTQQLLSKLPPQEVSPQRLREILNHRGGVRPFVEALRKPRNHKIAIIAELKKASPSAGIIRDEFDPVSIAQLYEEAGADCISVITESSYFKGSIEYLTQVREAVSLPLLRKDFIIDERQILEAAEYGADAILLIVAILPPQRLEYFLKLTEEAGMAALVEVHDIQELEIALKVGAQLIGINNRNLKTFHVDLATTEKIATRLSTHIQQGKVTLVAESGIKTAADVQRMIQCKVNALLIGEALMRTNDPRTLLQELMKT